MHVSFCRYASESIDIACKWGYKGVESGETLSGIKGSFFDATRGSIVKKNVILVCSLLPSFLSFLLTDDYFKSRLPIVMKRLAQGGVRLAMILNRVFIGDGLEMEDSFVAM